ncbi:hypothetical protein AURDEDRAFT_151552 [Auricularia subglabra TFB-10046 SS5]|nr:hypothetical protein AURDEDRAFT_151552 [Auricularia subglabra TFB-10046 SS5]
MFDSLSDPDTVFLITGLLKAFGSFDKILDLSKRVDLLECDQLAPTYGVLQSDAVIAMDDELKVAVAGSARAISRIPPAHRTWTAVMGALSQSPVLAPMPDSDVNRTDELIKERMNWFKGSSQYDAVVKEVQAWFTKLVVDPDVLKARTAVDIGAVTKIVAHAGNTIDGLVPYKKERRQTTLLDIGILRYPDTEHPFIKVYRIELFAWYESKMVLGRAHDRNGITGLLEFNARSFKPRESVIAGMRASAKEKAIAEADELFS